MWFDLMMSYREIGEQERAKNNFNEQITGFYGALQNDMINLFKVNSNHRGEDDFMGYGYF